LRAPNRKLKIENNFTSLNHPACIPKLAQVCRKSPNH
jgi:hypothetical protein